MPLFGFSDFDISEVLILSVGLEDCGVNWKSNTAKTLEDVLQIEWFLLEQ